MNFGGIFDLPLRMWPEKEALIHGAQRMTYVIWNNGQTASPMACVRSASAPEITLRCW